MVVSMAYSSDGYFALPGKCSFYVRNSNKNICCIYQEVMKETMERVPLLKEIVDHYCGPDRVTAKEQHGELKRVAKTLPASAPNSMKNFTDRAVLSLQVSFPSQPVFPV